LKRLIFIIKKAYFAHSNYYSQSLKIESGLDGIEVVLAKEYIYTGIEALLL
jgi:hypothetical protein